MGQRPVKCLFCKGQMYYEGEANHEPEVCLQVTGYTLISPAEAAYRPEYAHRRCFDAAVASTSKELLKWKGAANEHSVVI